ncbi:MAG: TIGR02281 family clan AA aspartic protease [Pseudomonadota bacterium]|nr:TIGR02281 family clan AA aspartic protease [Pseudomonadota bacterium]
MIKEAAVVFTAVLGGTCAALMLMPASAPQAQAALPVATAATAPAVASPPAPQASVSKAADGHFWAEASVNGARVRFLVDTGATTVALTEADARRLGLDTAALDYSTQVRTAAGDTRAAAVKLKSISVAGARINDVDALVVREGLSASLLGMSYLGRLSRFEASRTSLILKP